MYFVSVSHRIFCKYFEWTCVYSQREDCFHSVCISESVEKVLCIILHFTMLAAFIRFGLNWLTSSIRNMFASGDRSIFSLQLRYRYKKKKKREKERIIIINFDYIDDTRKKVTVLISIDRILFYFFFSLCRVYLFVASIATKRRAAMKEVKMRD